MIYLRIDEFEPEEPGLIIEEIITNPDMIFSCALTVVDKSGLRQRKY